MREHFDAIVVGAGVVGAACALGMAKAGQRVALVEAHVPAAWADAPRDLRVYAFAPDNAALLRRLGVWPTILARRAHAYRAMRVWDAAGGGELVFRAEDFARPELGHIVEHSLLVAMLWQACAEARDIRMHAPARLQSITQDEKGVQAELQDGTRLQAKVLIGADGAASKVRALCGIGSDAKDYQQRGIVAYLRTERPHEHTAWQRFLPSGPLAYLPCSEGLGSIVWTLPDGEAQRLLDCEASRFEAELERAFDGRLGAMHLVSERVAFPLRRDLAHAMQQGRVLLMGDAAHAVHPLAGQGVNLGLRDVGAWLDALSLDDAMHPARLQRWARARHAQNATATHAFETINRVFSNDAMLPTLLRGHTLGIADRLPPLKRWLIGEAAGF